MLLTHACKTPEMTSMYIRMLEYTQDGSYAGEVHEEHRC